MAGEKNDRQRVFASGEGALQIQPAWPGHLEVQQDAARRIGAGGLQKLRPEANVCTA